MERAPYEGHSQEHWDQLHGQARFRPRFPNEHVVRFLRGHFPDEPRAGLRALDVGVGGGRHTKLLCELGFETFGMDISAEGLRHTEAWLASEGHRATLQQASMFELPFSDGDFDAVISYGVYCYSTRADMARAIGELHRVLRIGGRAFVMIRTDRDFRFGKGKQLEPGTFSIETNETNEQGTVQHFVREDEVPTLFAAFSELRFERTETTFDQRRSLNSDWLIAVAK
jgi:SAM-dependent methyltransferase